MAGLNDLKNLKQPTQNAAPVDPENVAVNPVQEVAPEQKTKAKKEKAPKDPNAVKKPFGREADPVKVELRKKTMEAISTVLKNNPAGLTVSQIREAIYQESQSMTKEEAAKTERELRAFCRQLKCTTTAVGEGSKKKIYKLG